MFFYLLPLNLVRVCFITSTRFIHSSNKKNLDYLNKRSLFTNAVLNHGEYEWLDPKDENDVVYVTFINKNGKHIKVKGKVGDNVLYLAHR